MTDQTPDVPPVPPEEDVAPQDVVDLHTIALEVLSGRWGRGRARREKLEKAGYVPDDVALEVARVMANR